jgi:hypothetical protein
MPAPDVCYAPANPKVRALTALPAPSRPFPRNIRYFRVPVKLPSFFDWPWKRYGRYVALWLAIVTAFAFIPYWHYADILLYASLSGSTQRVDLSSRLLPIDLGVAPKSGVRAAPLRRQVTEVLRMLRCGTQRTASGGCDLSRQFVLYRPRFIVLDIEFTENCKGSDPRVESDLEAMLQDLISNGVDIYGINEPLVADPSPQERLNNCTASGGPVQRDEAIYGRGYVSGVGHTLMQALPAPLPNDVAWYPAWYEISPGVDLEALPLLITDIDQERDPTHDVDYVSFGIGPSCVFAGCGAQSALITLADMPKNVARLQGLNDVHGIVVIGNQPTETRIDGRTGFEILNWAISDRLRNSKHQLAQTWLMLFFTAVFSFLAAWAFLIIFRAVRTRKYCFTIAFTGAVLVSLVELAALVALFLAFNQIYTQIVLPGVGILAASFATLLWMVDTVRHERFLNMLAAQRRGGEQYDVFISYARDPVNARWVEENVYRPLSLVTGADGKPLRIFFDRQVLTVGMDWYARIVGGVYGSRFFIPVYSQDYFNRWFCRDELELALIRSRDNPNLFVLPLLRAAQKVPRRYRAIQYIDAEGDRAFIDQVVRIVTGGEKMPAAQTQDVRATTP